MGYGTVAWDDRLEHHPPVTGSGKAGGTGRNTAKLDNAAARFFILHSLESV